MLVAQFLEGFFDGSHASRFQVIISALNTFYRFLVVLPFPFQGGS